MRGTVVIRNPLGLHMRPAIAFAKFATRFRSNVTIRKQDRTVNGKSGLSLMTLAALPGTELELEVTGDDAEMAFPLLSRALESESADGLETLLN